MMSLKEETIQTMNITISDDCVDVFAFVFTFPEFFNCPPALDSQFSRLSWPSIQPICMKPKSCHRAIFETKNCNKKMFYKAKSSCGMIPKSDQNGLLTFVATTINSSLTCCVLFREMRLNSKNFWI